MSMDDPTPNPLGREGDIDPSVARLDERYLQATFGEDSDFLREVLETFIESSELLYAQVQQAIVEEDVVSVRSVAHTLKGSGRMIGANHFALCCQDVETGEAPVSLFFSKRMLLSLALLLEECRRRLAALKSV